MPLWEPKTFCGCGTPKIVTLVIGYLGAIGSVFEILGSLKVLTMDMDKIEDACRQQRNGNSEMCYKGAVIGLSIGMVLEAVYLAFCVMLIMGSKKGKPGLMMPYIILQWISVIILTVCSVAAVILCFAFGLLIGGLIFGGILGLCLFVAWYFLLIVRVHYREIQEQTNINNMEFSPLPSKA